MLIFFGNEDTSCCAHDAHIFSYAESTREISLAQSFPRKLKGPPNDPPLFSCFLPSSLSLSSLSTFPLFLVPQRIGIRGANLGGGGPRGEVGQSGGNGGVGQKVGRRRDMVKGPCNFCTDRPYLWELDNLHSILFDGAAQVLSSFVLYGSLQLI